MDKSPFKKLPAELRNIVYEMVLKTATEIALYPQIELEIDSDMVATRQMTAKSDAQSAKAARDCFALTMACKEIRSETIGLFYAINRFKFDPFLDIRVGQWGNASKQQYAEGLDAVRRWLESVPKAARQNIKLHIEFTYVDSSGSQNNLKPNRAVLWWKQTRKLESSILYSVVSPANIYAVFSVYHGNEFKYQHCTTHPRWADASDCQRSVFNEKSLLCDIPTANKDAAREEIEKAFRGYAEEVERRMATYPCGLDQEVRRRLQQDLDTVRMLVSDEY
ncbi:hypothetical protein EJ03DRAFT_352893 [Teratosphaeria nubilosa]|uniref:DUF7730 domain-containing protein n=1 Tax=Teratosphaeria nubilosa TaxID=161662 RepID=A0A6G1L4R9_9PEZI|nr:hypothetical protein EJ03DRAFT_352893 [Teratosphaeria nubilosa]